MFPLLTYLTAEIRHRSTRLRDAKDGGYTAESVVVIGLLILMAIAVVGIITLKIKAKADSLDLG